VLGGDNYEQREPSNVSSASSGAATHARG
jgi:hypothetical protein